MSHPSALPATTPSDTPLPKWWEAAVFVGPFTPTGEGGNDGFVRDAHGDMVANCFGFEARADVIAALLNSVGVSPSEGSAPDTPTWREAASAPQTGEHILVTKLGRAGFGYCGVRNVQQDWCAVVHYWPVEDEAGFYLSSGASASVDDYPVHFTHWMPLP